MGGTASRVNKEERVRVCRERRKLMKQLVRFRGEFADSQMVYMRALRNTGATLRQFTESESLELETTSYGLGLPSSPPPPLPPSPPPPPPLSPDLRKLDNDQKEVSPVESMEIIEDDVSTPPPPPVQDSTSWDIFGSYSPHYQKYEETVESNDDEKWADTKTKFDEDEREEETVANVVSMLPKKLQLEESVKDNSSTMRWPYPKDSADTTMILWKRKRTLESLAKELDEHFLKSSAGLKEIAVLMEIKGGDTFLLQRTNENKRKRCNSAKVFSALSWSRSARALQYSRDAVEGPSEPCRPGAHCITLRKLYEAEKKLYKDIKEEELIKLEYEGKSKILQKQEGEGDSINSEKLRFIVENLEGDMLHLQQSISSTCSSMVKLIDDELYPQLCRLISGLLHIWRTMHECHHFQNFVSQQLNNLTDIHKIDLSTTYHRQAAIQLESEVSCWANSFSEAIKSQQEYARTLCRWIQLTDSLVDDHRQSLYSSAVFRMCDQWQLTLDKSPNKEAADAIKSFLSAIHRICQQQEEEHNLQKKSEKLEKRLQKELHSLANLERKMNLSFLDGDSCSDLDPKHPFTIKRDKTEALKKQVEIERTKYLDEVQVSKNMILNNLKTTLPKVFQALMAFSSAYVQGLEAVSTEETKQAESSEGEVQTS